MRRYSVGSSNLILNLVEPWYYISRSELQHPSDEEELQVALHKLTCVLSLPTKPHTIEGNSNRLQRILSLLAHFSFHPPPLLPQYPTENDVALGQPVSG